MKIFFITALLITSTAAYSQELDQAYLDSLPVNIKDDVLKKIDERDAGEKPIYRRESSMVDKPLDSKRFGDKIFNMMQSSFMPINEPNLDSSYTLDFGDTLEIQFIGKKNLIEELSVKRDGSINIPEIGKIFVSGLSLNEVSKLIKTKVSNAYIGVESFITLINVRDIQVLVTGNAFNPGIYTLNGNSNMLHALNMAGGIDINGSYRNIDLIRNDEVIDSIDMYDIFINGKSGFGKRLRSGDIILISPYLKIVSLSGAVKRPGIYELTADEKFSDLIIYGNGFSDNADLKTLRVERADQKLVNFINVSNLNELDNIEVQSSDRLNIRSYERKYVKITGAVKTPGTYTISTGETLSSLINKAQGYTNDAYPFGAILNNKKSLILSEEANKKLYDSFIRELITKGNSLFASESLPFILDKLKSSVPSGRLMAEFDLDVIKANPHLDTTLHDGDEIIVPVQTEQVYIFGEVSSGGATRYVPNSNINDYIATVGGVLKSADTKNIFIVHPNGEINRLISSRLSFVNNRGDEILIYPGSVIYIPRKTQFRDPSLIASIWAPIVSSAATSITALSVLNNQ